jgi:hypothetical protein
METPYMPDMECSFHLPQVPAPAFADVVWQGAIVKEDKVVLIDDLVATGASP